MTEMIPDAAPTSVDEPTSCSRRVMLASSAMLIAGCRPSNAQEGAKAAADPLPPPYFAPGLWMDKALTGKAATFKHEHTFMTKVEEFVARCMKTPPVFEFLAAPALPQDFPYWEAKTEKAIREAIKEQLTADYSIKDEPPMAATCWPKKTGWGTVRMYQLWKKGVAWKADEIVTEWLKDPTLPERPSSDVETELRAIPIMIYYYAEIPKHPR
jgi:hypothetical protein